MPTYGDLVMAEQNNEHEDGIRVIKKYPNRRIYDTHTSKYIRIEDIRDMIVDGIEKSSVPSFSF